MRESNGTQGLASTTSYDTKRAPGSERVLTTTVDNLEHIESRVRWPPVPVGTELVAVVAALVAGGLWSVRIHHRAASPANAILVACLTLTHRQSRVMISYGLRRLSPDQQAPSAMVEASK